MQMCNVPHYIADDCDFPFSFCDVLDGIREAFPPETESSITFGRLGFEFQATEIHFKIKSKTFVQFTANFWTRNFSAAGL